MLIQIMSAAVSRQTCTHSLCCLLQSDDMCASPAKDFDQSPVNLQTYVMTQLVSTSLESLPVVMHLIDLHLPVCAVQLSSRGLRTEPSISR